MYRLYRIDGTGRFSTAEWIDASDGETAVAIVAVGGASDRYDLWHRDRLVASTRPGQPPAGS
jgi:hypothetical protein